MNDLVVVAEFALLVFSFIFACAWAVHAGAEYIKKRLTDEA